MTQINQEGAAALERAPSVRELGEALWGEHWQSPMARALRANIRTVQHWAAGNYQPSCATMRKLVALLEDRQARTTAVLQRGRAMIDYFDSVRGKSAR